MKRVFASLIVSFFSAYQAFASPAEDTLSKLRDTPVSQLDFGMYLLEQEMGKLTRPGEMLAEYEATASLNWWRDPAKPEAKAEPTISIDFYKPEGEMSEEGCRAVMQEFHDTAFQFADDRSIFAMYLFPYHGPDGAFEASDHKNMDQIIEVSVDTGKTSCRAHLKGNDVRFDEDVELDP